MSVWMVMGVRISGNITVCDGVWIDVNRVWRISQMIHVKRYAITTIYIGNNELNKINMDVILFDKLSVKRKLGKALMKPNITDWA